MIKKLKGNNTGAISITRVICYFLLVLFIAFVLDLIFVMTQNVVMSYEAAYYAEKVSIQGGLLGDEMSYPSLNEVHGTTDVCGSYKKPCTSCLTNAVMSERISKTLNYFGVKAEEWDGAYETEGNNRLFHDGQSPGNGNKSRLVSNYMKTGVFKLSSVWHPKFAHFVFSIGGKESYRINKFVPIIVEYIPRTNTDDPACVSYGGA